jgi:hypothetical protein
VRLDYLIPTTDRRVNLPFGVPGSKLPSLQMRPAALRLMVVERARLAALQTGPLHTRASCTSGCELPIGHLQFDPVHTPGGLNPQNFGHTVRDYAITHSNPG